jgi:hypothetical protein
MKSPFPGMDPYLEADWDDVHARMIPYAASLLRKTLPSDLRARVERRLFVEAPGACPIYPDVTIIERPYPMSRAAATGGVATLEPLIVHLEDEPATQGYIEIVERRTGGRVVTVIEILSPANKVPGDGQAAFLRKQEETRAAGVSAVEIDLLRAGEHVLMAPLYKIPSTRRTPYLVCWRRGWKPREVGVYPISLRSPLPVIDIPLREGDQDASLDLQALVELVYEEGEYGDTDYRQEPEPPLSGEDAEWADRLLREKGLR